MEEFECYGSWYLPEDESVTVAGKLSVSSSGETKLELAGTLGGALRHDRGKELAVIHGRVDGHGMHIVTLAGCYQTRWSTEFGGREEYLIQRSYFGAHLDKPISATFRRATVRLGALGVWAQTLSGFRDGNLGGKSTGEEAALLYYAMSEPKYAQLGGAELTLGFGLGTSAKSGERRHTEEASITITCDPPLTDSEICSRFIYPLQNLMTFVAGVPQEIELLTLRKEDALCDFSENPKIQVISPNVISAANRPVARDLHRDQLLFTLDDVSDSFQDLINSWLRLSKKFSDACDVFFALQYSAPSYLDVSFLGIVQALSLYYTRTEDGHKRSEQERKRLAEVLDKLETADTEWLGKRTNPRSLPPIQEVLHALLKTNAQLFSGLRVFDETDIERVVLTMEYALYRTTDSRELASYGNALLVLVERLRLFLKVAFLRELAFPEEAIRKLVEKSPQLPRT